MSTRNHVPRADNEGRVGRPDKRWQSVNAYAAEFDTLTVGTVNATDIPMLTTHNADNAAHSDIRDEIDVLRNGSIAPNAFEYDEKFSATEKTTITSPAWLKVVIDGYAYFCNESVALDITDYSVWDLPATLWQPSTDYELGARVYPSTTKTGYVYVCTTGGRSSTLTPTWPTTVGETYNDGNCVWKCAIDITYGTNRKGMDLYIYACKPTSAISTAPEFVISQNGTVPNGYNANNSRKIGGFHTLCANVGTISGHALSGYSAGDILPCSVWDLNHRPKSNPEGMVYIEGLDIWVDIYLNSWTGTTAAKTLETVSRSGAVTGDGASTEKFHPLKWEQTMGEQKKRLPWVREFRVFSVGSNQGTNISGSADANTAGGHVDTAGRRMISNYGIEDCCGFLWQWCSDVGSASTSASWTAGYDGNDRNDIAGQIYGAEYRPLVGGSWDDGVICGSRGASWSRGSLYLAASYGARGASEPAARLA